MRRLFLAWIILCLAIQFLPEPVQAADEYIMVVTADSAVVPALEQYLDRALTQAEDDGAALVIIELDTPGGSVSVTNDIIERIRASEVPVVVYVSPSGGMAASAGALITLSGHVSVMAPNTVIGAASPINSDGSDLNETSELKAQEILTATMRTLTEDRPPEAQRLAEAMITDAVAVSATEALEIGLIDYIVSDNDQLVEVLEGRNIELGDGTAVTLQLSGLAFRTVDMNLIEQALTLLANPVLVFLLFSTGVILIVIELRTPGGFIAGTLGAVSIVLSLYGFGVLPVNLLGLLFFALAAILFVMELAIPESFGILTFFGAIALAAGGLIMFNNEAVDQFGGVPWYIIVGQSGGVAALGLLVFYYIIRTMPGGSLMGETAMLGMLGEVRVPLQPQGIIFVNGERWKAQATDGQHIDIGETVRVVEMEDLMLTVEIIPPGEQNDHQ